MKASLGAFCSGIFGYTFGYGTPKIVHIRSFKIGLVNRLVQFAVIGYVIGYAIIFKKGYQEHDVAQSAVTTKLKGIASTVDNQSLPLEYRRVWDTAEFVPTQENNAFFVMTNAIITVNQTEGLCPEDPNLQSCSPTERRPCIKGVVVENGHGVMTGQCLEIKGSRSGTYGCEVRGWCPVEKDELIIPDRPLISEAIDFSVFIKNNIEFPKFKLHRSNVFNQINNEDYLKRCRYNPANEATKYCPVFKLGDMIKSTTTDGKPTNFYDIATKGGVISIRIKWDCDLDKGRDRCVPTYDFHRLDDPVVPTSKGYNFRYAKYYYLRNNIPARDLTKAYGILFIITVEGKAGQFSILPLALNIGAGLGLFGLAKILTDFFLLNFTSRRKEYKQHKYTRLVAEDFARMTRGISRQPKSVTNGSRSVSGDSVTKSKSQSQIQETAT